MTQNTEAETIRAVAAQEESRMFPDPEETVFRIMRYPEFSDPTDQAGRAIIRRILEAGVRGQC